MQIALKIPSSTDLRKAYEFFETSARSPRTRTGDDFKKIALYTQWVRFDARLGEIIVAFLSTHWSMMPAALLNQELMCLPWPAVMGVLLAHVELILKGEEKRKFKLWRALVFHSIESATGELFFIGTRKIAGLQMSLDASRSITPYSQWGYLARDLLFNKAGKLRSKHTLLTPFQRNLLLKELVRERKRITVNHYIEKCDGMVSRRQAQLDLERFSEMKNKAYSKGQTRNRVYIY